MASSLINVLMHTVHWYLLGNFKYNLQCLLHNPSADLFNVYVQPFCTGAKLLQLTLSTIFFKSVPLRSQLSTVDCPLGGTRWMQKSRNRSNINTSTVGQRRRGRSWGNREAPQKKMTANAIPKLLLCNLLYAWQRLFTGQS